MKKPSHVAIAIVAALALFVGVFAYPVVAGSHPLSVSSGAPATAGHPRTADSSGNETNDTEFDDHQGSSSNETSDHSSDVNETENETGSGSPDQGGNGTGEDSSSGSSGVDLASVESSIVSSVDSFAADLVSGIHLAGPAPVL